MKREVVTHHVSTYYERLARERRRKTILIIALVVVLAIAAAAAIYIIFFQYSACGDVECFQQNMRNCDRATYTNEEQEASWGYKIKGTNDGRCVIDVTLVYAKQGELGIDKLQGLSMECSYTKGSVAYPEKDLTKCHGILKEELQGVIINKLHAYIIDNLGQIGKGLTTLGT